MPFQRIALNNFFYLSAALGFTSLAVTSDWGVESKKYCAFAAVTGSVTFLECTSTDFMPMPTVGGWPTFPAFSVTHKPVGAPSFAAFAKGGIPHRSPHRF
jgi:hypothetical protein